MQRQRRSNLASCTELCVHGFRISTSNKHEGGWSACRRHGETHRLYPWRMYSLFFCHSSSSSQCRVFDVGLDLSLRFEECLYLPFLPFRALCRVVMFDDSRMFYEVEERVFVEILQNRAQEIQSQRKYRVERTFWLRTKVPWGWYDCHTPSK